MCVPAKVINLKNLLEDPNFERVIDSDGKVIPPSSNIYVILSTSLSDKHKMQPKYIYTLLKLNRYNLYSDMLAFYNIEPPNCDYSYMNSTLDMSNVGYEFRLDVTTIWPSMMAENGEFRNQGRNIRTLRKHSWTHVLYEQIFNFTNIPCALIFKYSKLSESGIFLRVTAYCTECTSEFIGKIIFEPREGESILMECSILNFDRAVNHVKKRPLQGKLRRAVGNHLIEKNMLPCQYRRNEAHRLIATIGDDSPPTLCSNEVYGKAKQEALNKYLGVRGENALVGILNLKYTEYYTGIIHNIGLDPFFVHYWSKEQMFLYTKFSETLILDATGSIVRPIKLPNKEFGPHIFLFQAVILINGRSIPAFQMLSSVKTTVAIINWLLEFEKECLKELNTFPVPKELVCDFDKAILGASARVFARSNSLKHYLDWCYDVICGKVDVFPACVLRLDVCHFTQIIARWKCYPKYNIGVRTLYLRAMCVLRKQETFDDFHEILLAILTLSLYKTGNRGSPAEVAKEFIRSKIKGIPMEVAESHPDEAQNSESIEVDLSFEDDLDDLNIQDYANRTYNQIQAYAKVDIVGEDDELNGYFLPEFALKLKTLIPYFPLYTEIVRKLRKFGQINATSAPVESYFNDLKNRELRSVSLPLRVDKFVAIHCKEVEKYLKEAAAGSTKLYERQETQHTKTSSSSDADSELNLELNWRNKNRLAHNIDEKDNNSSSKLCSRFSKGKRIRSVSEPIRNRSNSSSSSEVADVTNFKKLQKMSTSRVKRKPVRYADEFPEFEPNSDRGVAWLPILPNGSVCHNIKGTNCTTKLTNTCAFDSVFQIISLAIANNKNYNENTINIETPIYIMARSFIKNKKISAKIFKMRWEILRDLRFSQTSESAFENNNGKIIRMENITSLCNVTEMAMELLASIPSYVTVYQCCNCKRSQTETFNEVRIHIQKRKEGGLKNLKNALDFVEREKSCCQRSMSYSTHFSAHLIICVELGRGVRNQDRICEIPVFIEPNMEKKYKIFGFIDRLGDDESGHYVAFCLIGTTWLRYDDLQSGKKAVPVDVSINVRPQILFYIEEPNLQN